MRSIKLRCRNTPSPKREGYKLDVGGDSPT
nr:MAG TPA: hypothetical protein [Caudoviricetes sp.]